MITVPELPYSIKDVKNKRAREKKEQSNPHICSWKQVWTSGSKYIMKCEDCGRTRDISYSKADNAAMKRGDTLQPIGKDKDKFAFKYGHLPGEDPKDVRKFIWKNRHRA